MPYHILFAAMNTLHNQCGSNSTMKWWAEPIGLSIELIFIYCKKREQRNWI